MKNITIDGVEYAPVNHQSGTKSHEKKMTAMADIPYKPVIRDRKVERAKASQIPGYEAAREEITVDDVAHLANATVDLVRGQVRPAAEGEVAELVAVLEYEATNCTCSMVTSGDLRRIAELLQRIPGLEAELLECQGWR